MSAPKLNADELIEFEQARDYLAEKASYTPQQQRQHGFAEGSVGNLLNSLSPNVRKMFKAIDTAMETPRLAPFQPKMSEAEVADALGFDPYAATEIKAALDIQDVASGIQSRMGTDQPDTSPPTMRDNIAAAFDAHAGD